MSTPPPRKSPRPAPPRRTPVTPAPPPDDGIDLAPLDDTPPPPLPTRIVADEITCTHCGYILRGLQENARCPECGTPIEDSFGSGGLELADWHWLEKVGHGILFILLATVLEPVGHFIGISHHNVLLGEVLFCAAAALDVVGILLMTQPDPRARLTGEYASTRTLLRVIALVAFTGGLLRVAAVGLELKALLLAGQTLMLADAARAFLYYRLLRVYAGRLPGAGLALQCTILMWALPITQAVTWGPALLAAATGISELALFWCLGILPLLLFGIWAFVVNMQMLDAFSAAARTARQRAGIPVWP